ncbi:alanine racemase [Thiorhodococcus minor]|uniref:Alanine racemase n=1 Tax=Thiorhodococcus minor TaxID=57489 RepID=A0A6M0JW44_9GAMM|nr:alanine racemase [Thiorhodococcus minor]NEV61740.1 alanine racemase [Thiorhodococcus minor]
MTPQARPLSARIHLDAILHNYRLAKRAAPAARALAIIKANAYGHGAVRVGQALAPEADGFAVACVAEALELRESGIRNRVLLLEGAFSPDEIVLADRAGLALVVHCQQQLDWVLAARPERPLECWIKIDSGMHRVGFAPGDFRAAHARLRGCPHVAAVHAMTHFARADEPRHPYTANQVEVFDGALQGLQLPCSLANSAAILAWPQTHRDWVRPGIMLYGASPFAEAVARAAGLRPAMTLESALISIRDLAPGEPVGYGGRFVCDRPMRVGVVAVGYADGYPRHAKDGTPVAVNGQLTRVIGRVSMDMITVDLTGLDNAGLGDRVELWGRRVAAADVARWSDTIAYQLFTSISRRVPLVYASG